jgi:hypothetical protein
VALFFLAKTMDLYLNFPEELSQPAKSWAEKEVQRKAAQAVNNHSTMNTQPAPAAPHGQTLLDLEPANQFNGSFSELLRLLPVGQCAAKVKRLDWDNLPSNNDPLMLRSMREDLRNSLASAVSRARIANNGFYNIEVTECTTPGGNIYLVAVVTRTK